MDPNLAFTIGNPLAMAAWVALAVSLFVPAVRRPVWIATGIAIPALFGIGYAILIAASYGNAPGGGFGSLGAVRALFANDSALGAGWLHFLAFDLFVGTWIARRGVKSGVPALLVLPCLALTFFIGPAGFLLFLLLRALFRRRKQAQPAAV